jgi:hypothetical protein
MTRAITRVISQAHLEYDAMQVRNVPACVIAAVEQMYRVLMANGPRDVTIKMSVETPDLQQPDQSKLDIGEDEPDEARHHLRLTRNERLQMAADAGFDTLEDYRCEK